MNFQSICLECDWEPSWDDAKTRLKVATELMGFPLFITMDETAYAYQSIDDYLAERLDDETASARAWWDENAQAVPDYQTGLRVLYPWFHDGEPMPDRTTD